MLTRRRLSDNRLWKSLPELRFLHINRFGTTARACERIVVGQSAQLSSFAEAHKVLLPEPTHMEDEDEDQENEKEDERDVKECKVESRREIRTTTAHEAWMT